MPANSKPPTTDPDNVSFERWVVMEQLRLKDFVAFWRNGARGLNADGIPAGVFTDHQPVEEWNEQYRSWGESQNDDLINEWEAEHG